MIRFDLISIWFFSSPKSKFFDLIFVDSIRFDLSFLRFEIERLMNTVKNSHRNILRHFINVYIYTLVLYTTCVRDEIFVFYCEIVKLIRRIQKLFELCKSNKNWTQLQSLKIYDWWSYSQLDVDVFDVLASLLIFSVKKISLLFLNNTIFLREYYFSLDIIKRDTIIQKKKWYIK
jgi:ribosomal protein L36